MRSRNAAKLVVLLVLIGGIVALYFSPLRAYLTRAHIDVVITHFRAVWYAPFVLVAAYGIGCLFAIPASLFVIASAAIWGWKLGAIYALCGALIGATISYFAGRFLGEGLLERCGRPGALVARQVKDAGLVSMVIIRLIPGPPFALWNYGAGIACMPFGDYFFGTLLGILPAHFIFAYCTDSLFNGTMTQGDAVVRVAVVGLLLIVMIAGTTILKRRFAPAPQSK